MGFIYWHLMVLGQRLAKWAGARHGKTLAKQKLNYAKPVIVRDYTERMRNYYGIVGRDIPPVSHTAYWLDKQLGANYRAKAGEGVAGYFG